MTNTNFVANVTNALTIVIAVAFLSVSTFGIVSPVKAQVSANAPVTSTAR